MLLCGSALLNIVLGVASAHLGAPEAEEGAFQEIVLEGARDQEDKILDLQVSGVITDEERAAALSARRDPVSLITAQLKQARKDEHIKGILLEVDSPGGGITASDIIYHELATYRKEKKVPVVVLFRDLAASGGYYVSMASDHIMAHETSLCGSIGVIAQFADVHALLGKIGVRMNTIKSQRFDGTESMKDIGSPFREMKPAERKLWQTMIAQMWRRFVDVVAEGRKGKMTHRQVEEIADGRVFTAGQALELKLVDSVGYRQDAWKKAAELGKAPHARLVQYHRHTSFLRELFASRSQPAGLDAALSRVADPLAASSPRLMYLWAR